MAKDERPTVLQNKRSSLVNILNDVFDHVRFPVEKSDLLVHARGVELQVGSGRVLMLSDILENCYRESFNTLLDVIQVAQNEIDAAGADDQRAKASPPKGPASS